MFDEAERAMRAVQEMGEVDRACLMHPPSDTDRVLYEVLTDAVALYLVRCRGERRLDKKTVKAYSCDIEQFLIWLDEGTKPFNRLSATTWSTSTVCTLPARCAESWHLCAHGLLGCVARAS